MESGSDFLIVASILIGKSVHLSGSIPIFSAIFSVEQICSFIRKVLVACVFLESRFVESEQDFQSAPDSRACLDFCPTVNGFI